MAAVGRLGWGVFGVVLALACSASPARADAEWIVVAGTSHGGGPHLSGTGEAAPLGQRPVSGESVSTPSDREVRLATIAIGLAGSEGRVRGGGELMTVLGFAGDTAGYTAFVTYAGVTGRRLFAQTGLGLGMLWGRPADDRGFVDRLAGDLRVEIGVNLHDQWMVVGRGDLIVGQAALEPVATLALQWMHR